MAEKSGEKSETEQTEWAEVAAAAPAQDAPCSGPGSEAARVPEGGASSVGWVHDRGRQPQTTPAGAGQELPLGFPTEAGRSEWRGTGTSPAAEVRTGPPAIGCLFLLSRLTSTVSVPETTIGAPTNGGKRGLFFYFEENICPTAEQQRRTKPPSSSATGVPRPASPPPSPP